ncbi:hypothetical protein NBRC111452_1612 [Companilactobacillus farciminis]|jgi:hypothetical protein|nr:hypothetical protein NBRC111452_1612 [Companilactobacillus farciminis]
MSFLKMIIIFVLGLFLLVYAGHVKSRFISKSLFACGTLSVLMAMYIAWPK